MATKIKAGNFDQSATTYVIQQVSSTVADPTNTTIRPTMENMIDSAFGNVVGGTGITYTHATKTFDLTNTGVSAATYGDSSTIPSLTINAQGQITAVSNKSIYIPPGYDQTNFDSDLATKTTDDLTEGSTNLYFSGKTTTDLSEGTNLYYTTARHDSDFDARLSGGTGVTVSSGQVSIGQAVATNSNVTFQNVTVQGDLQVDGTQNIINTQSLSIEDNIIYLNSAESSGSPTQYIDVGIAANYNDVGSYAHAGFFRDATDGVWKLFQGYTPEPAFSSEINTGHASFALAPLQVSTITGVYAGFDSDFTSKSTTDLSEGTNLYYTSARANSDFDTRLATKSTTNLSEGTNLYYTNTRADARIALQVGANLDLSSKSTSDLSEGTNLYYTNARADARIALQVGANLDLSSKSTTNLSEGTNLYYTTARANSAIDARVTKAFVDALNVDADTLDGISSASFLRSDANDTMSNNLTINGTLGVGVTASSTKLDVGGADYVAVRIRSANQTGYAGMEFTDEITSLSQTGYFRHTHGDTNTLNTTGQSGNASFLIGSTEADNVIGFNTGMSASANGTNRGSIKFTASGTTYNTSSDRRLKENIEPIVDGKEKLLAMKPSTFNFIEDETKTKMHGFIAQEMKEIVPEAVSDSTTTMSMDYGRITPVIVAALQDALKEIEELKVRIKELEAK
jgi:hypothetical protein